MNTNIYQKLKEIRKQIGQIKKEEANTFQNYKYISEYTYFNKINPLLEKHGLIMTFEDTDIPINVQKEGKEWAVSYQKRVVITDVENERSLIFKVWGAGQNTDIAKAKGSADTYAVKYFLQKFFMIPVSDKTVLDPDAMSNEKENDLDKKHPSEVAPNRELTEAEKIQANEILTRHGFDTLAEKCFKCNQGFSPKLLKEVQTKAGESKKICFTCYDKIKKNYEPSN